MDTWTDLATIVGGLLTLTTAAVNLAAAVLQTRGRRRNVDDQEPKRR
jgi:hypothetical protein